MVMNTNEVRETWLWVQYREISKSVTEVVEYSVHWLSSKRSWTSISMVPGGLNYLSGELTSGGLGGFRTIWFEREDPLLGVSKPITVINIGLTQDGDYLLEVIGQQSDRIKKKWEGKYSKRMRGIVTLIWKENHEI